MKIECENCRKEIERHIFCSDNCRKRFDRKADKEVKDVRKEDEDVLEADIEEKPKEYKIGCKLHGLKNCKLGTCLK